MTVIAVEDWMTPVISVPAITPLIGVPAALASKCAHLVDGQRLDAVRHELEAEHEDAEPADHRNENVLEDVDIHDDTRSEAAPAELVFGEPKLCAQ